MVGITNQLQYCSGPSATWQALLNDCSTPELCALVTYSLPLQT